MSMPTECEDECIVTVSAAVVVLDSRSLGLEDLDEHGVQLDALHAHPAECCQEEIVQQSGNH